MNPSYETTAVVFLDVLGTRTRNSFDEKLSVHRVFHEEVQRHAARQQQLQHAIYKRVLRSFSDCVYIFYNYKEAIEEPRKHNLNLLYICLCNATISILRILSAGFLVRGGATLGECFIDELGFFGPAVEEAHCIESEQAIYPRIVLSNEVGSRLAEWERSQESGDVFSSIFTSIPRLIVKDDDGRFYINVFYELEKSGILQYGDEKLVLEKLKEQVCNKILADEIKYKDCEKIMRNLAWMKRFTDKSKVKLNPDIVSGAGTIVFGQ
jgi:hypothetical protein